MINVPDLENRWLKFKIKSYIPHAVIIASIIVITVLSLVFFNGDENKTNTKVKEKSNQTDTIKKQEAKAEKKEIETVQKQSKIENIEKEILKKKNHVLETEQNTTNKIQVTLPKHDLELKHTKEKLLLKPSLNFMRDMQNDTLPYYENDEETPKHKVKIPTKSNNKVEKIKNTEVKQTNVESQKKSISINRQNTQEDIHHVIKRFKINNNPALSLFIAKKYYELGEYHKSYNYALITNEINSNIEASWIIFAKSLVKLNERDMAIKTLKTYFDHSGSNKAKILLDEIISGKFK